VGDVITAIDGKKVGNNSDLTNAVGLMPPGKKIVVEFYREGKKKETDLKLSAYPDEEVADKSGGPDLDKNHLGGFKLSPLTPASAGKLKERFEFESEKGLLVMDVAPGSRAEASGIRPGDVLLKANRKPIVNLAEFKKLVESSQKILIQLERKGNYLFASF
jgi:S1-C subfamily serine protease